MDGNRGTGEEQGGEPGGGPEPEPGGDPLQEAGAGILRRMRRRLPG